MQAPANDNKPLRIYVPSIPNPAFMIVMSGEGWNVMIGIPGAAPAAKQA